MLHIERFKQFFESLSTVEKEAVLKYAYDNRPRPELLLSRIFGYENTGSAFDLDLASGQSSEQFPLGKYEFKEHFLASETGNVAIEMECSGKPSGLSTTRADWWVHWLSGNEYRKEVAVLITPCRLWKIADTCWRKQGGDNGVALNAIVPVKRLLASDSEIRKFARKQAPQIQMFP